MGRCTYVCKISVICLVEVVIQDKRNPQPYHQWLNDKVKDRHIHVRANLQVQHITYSFLSAPPPPLPHPHIVATPHVIHLHPLTPPSLPDELLEVRAEPLVVGDGVQHLAVVDESEQPTQHADGCVRMQLAHKLLHEIRGRGKFKNGTIL